MRRTELDFQRLADSFIRQQKVRLTFDGQVAGPEVHGFHGLAPYVFLHATRLPDAAHLPSMAMPFRFYRDPQQSLMGLSCALNTPDQSVSATDLVVGMMAYGQAFSHMKKDIEHFAKAVPDGWGHLVHQRGDQTMIDIEGFDWVARLRYGDKLDLVSTNEITQEQVDGPKLSAADLLASAGQSVRDKVDTSDMLGVRRHEPDLG